MRDIEQKGNGFSARINMFLECPYTHVHCLFIIQKQTLVTFKTAKVHLGEILSAFELMDRESMEMVTENLKLSNPITSSRFYALIETSGSNKDHDEEKISSLLETLLNSGQITDGTLATDESKIQVS